jgi:uncharacterized protein
MVNTPPEPSLDQEAEKQEAEHVVEGANFLETNPSEKNLLEEAPKTTNFKGQNLERMCLVTRVHGTPETLLRFVIDPDGVVMADIKAKLPGRGVWLSANKGVVEKAVQRKLFSKGFKKPVTCPPHLADHVEALLRRDMLGALSLANKAGCVVSGLAKVESAFRVGKVKALILAQEGQDTGAARLMSQAQQAFDVIIVSSLLSDELNLALGKPHVIHAACLREEGSQGFMRTWHRFLRYQAKDETTHPAR